jgi:O-antigen biosynthesis protein
MTTKSKKLKVFLRVPLVADCGVGYYRQWLPLQVARLKGECNFLCNKFTWGERKDDTPMTDAELKEAGEYGDILYFARNDVPKYIATAGGMKEFFKKPIVMDLDDNVQVTRPYNPGYRSFHPNSPNMSWNIKSMGVFDALTVSTKNLKEYYAKYMDKDKIFICPNSLDWKEREEAYKADFSQSELFRKKDGEIRIGWAGSSAHWENIKHIEEPVVQILRDYPNTTFYYTGLFGDLFQQPDIKDRVHLIPWSNLKDWAKFNREMNFDIALAPLADNMFNRAKSNLRLLEYSSARYPIVCSPVEPYLNFDGVLYAKEQEEWYNQIEKLVKDKDLRDKKGMESYKFAKKNFDMDVNYKLWLKAFEKILKSVK